MRVVFFDCNRLLQVVCACVGVIAFGQGVDKADPCDAHMLEDLGWLQQYIKVGFFTDYRNLAWHYYATNETTYAFLWLNSISYANLDFLRQACPQAAQLALLLRAEERLPSREADAPLLDFGTLAVGQVLSREVRETWPIDHGLVRLTRLAQAMLVPEEYSVDVVMPYCNEPLNELLSKKTGYEDEWLASAVPLRHARLILYRLTSCGSESMESLPPDALSAASRFAAVEVVPVEANPQVWEAARYFLHMARRYDSLADFTIVLHPDVFEHVNPRTLRNVLQSLRLGTFGLSGNAPDWAQYLSLSHHYLMRPSRAQVASVNCTDVDLGFRDLWQQLFGVHGNLEDNLDFGFYCCSQFLVHRDAVRTRPREWYEAAVGGVAWEHCATSYMELLWHGIFSRGVLHEAKRQERSELPLFLRVDNFLEATSDGLI
mmetsp:Transcript_15843/g.37387  ORF Transcript_15843/g.37387 Transcript_15843/m.37387 type:complete len:431 (+) Transcript_15843:99-1391(+)